MRQVTHALLTRPPLDRISASTDLLSFDLHVLSTPPAFILSQDQTLVKNVCIRVRIAWQFCSCLLFWFDIFRCPFLKNLFKEFSGFVVYCSVINVLFCCCRFMRQLLYYIKVFHVCQQLFYFFFCCCEAVPHATAYLE